MAPSRHDCPFEGEVWGVNNGYKQVREMKGGYINKLFLAHCQVYDNDGNEVFNWDEINKLGVEVILAHHTVKELKNVTRYPYKEIVKKFGCDYFSDTICYMIAYAIYKGYERIHIYGVDMMSSGEYWSEKGGVEYWIGYARGKGIEVTTQSASELMKSVDGIPYGKKMTLKDIDPEGRLAYKRGKFVMTEVQDECFGLFQVLDSGEAA